MAKEWRKTVSTEWSESSHVDLEGGIRILSRRFGAQDDEDDDWEDDDWDDDEDLDEDLDWDDDDWDDDDDLDEDLDEVEEPDVPEEEEEDWG